MQDPSSGRNLSDAAEAGRAPPEDGTSVAKNSIDTPAAAKSSVETSPSGATGTAIVRVRIPEVDDGGPPGGIPRGSSSPDALDLIAMDTGPPLRNETDPAASSQRATSAALGLIAMDAGRLSRAETAVASPGRAAAAAVESRSDELRGHLYFEAGPSYKPATVTAPFVASVDLARPAAVAAVWQAAAKHFGFASAADMRVFDPLVTERVVKPTTEDMQDMLSRFIADQFDVDLMQVHFKLQVSAAPSHPPVQRPNPTDRPAAAAAAAAAACPARVDASSVNASSSRPDTPSMDTSSARPGASLAARPGAPADISPDRRPTLNRPGDGGNGPEGKNGRTLLGEGLRDWRECVRLLSLVNVQIVSTVPANSGVADQALTLDTLGQTLAAGLQAWYLFTQTRVPEAQEFVRQTLALMSSGACDDDIILCPLFALFPALESHAFVRKRLPKLARVVRLLVAACALSSPDPALQAQGLLALIASLSPRK